LVWKYASWQPCFRAASLTIVYVFIFTQALATQCPNSTLAILRLL
jgi:hypothetical protein